MYARNPLKAKPYSLRKQMMISLPPTYHYNGSLIIIRQTRMVLIGTSRFTHSESIEIFNLQTGTQHPDTKDYGEYK